MFCAVSENQVKLIYYHSVVIGYRKHTKEKSQSRQENARAYLNPTISEKIESIGSCYSRPLTVQPSKYSDARSSIRAV